MDKKITEDWIWMMNWCKKMGYPPAEAWAWNRAAKALHDFKENGNG